MKILYDHQRFSLQKYGGITKYFSEIITNLPAGHEYQLALYFSDNQYLAEKRQFFRKKNILPDKSFPKKDEVKKIIYAVNQWYSKRCISANDFDVFHPTFYDDYFLKILKRPYVVTVHDLIEFRFQEMFVHHEEIRRQMERVIKNANRVIAISEHTKKDVMEIFGIDAGKIDVIHHGFNKPPGKETRNVYGRYILFVGHRDRYKNFKTFAKAAGVLLGKEKDIRLVCVGSQFNREETEELSNLNILDRSLSLYVDEESLNALYAHALTFVFPSRYEGFGMPILEAFANNCPVCLSDASCFPEIAGNAGVYFDPGEPDSILSAMEKIIYSKDFAAEIIKAGQKKLENFSWKKAANETILSYQKVIS